VSHRRSTRLEQVARQLRHEVVQQEDRERQAESRVRQPDAEERAVQVAGAVDLQDRNQRHLDRDDEQPDHDDEQHAPAAERDPRETHTPRMAAMVIGMTVDGMVTIRLLMNALPIPSLEMTVA
jgi:chemotaxis response regulator CheB